MKELEYGIRTGKFNLSKASILICIIFKSFDICTVHLVINSKKHLNPKNVCLQEIIKLTVSPLVGVNIMSIHIVLDKHCNNRVVARKQYPVHGPKT